MVDFSGLDAAFQALGHPIRREMLARLAHGERTVGELAEPFDVSLAASSKHLKVLERAGLVRRRIDGRRHTLRLDPEPLARAAECASGLARVFAANFAALDAVLGELVAAQPAKPGRKAQKQPKPTRNPRRG